MAVKLRLTRMGAKKAPFYRIVATDSRKARDGQYIEQIGYYNPVADPAEVKIDEIIAAQEPFPLLPAMCIYLSFF